MAQQPAQYVFTNLSTSNGLASNIVTSIVQDNKGYMWFATINGLQRFDGNKFLTFKSIPENPSTIPTNYLRGMFIDKKARLWIIGNNNQVGIFNTSKFLFENVSIQTEKKQKSYIFKHFIQAHDGGIYLYEENNSHIYKLDEAKQQFIRDSSFFKMPKSWHAKRITWDPFINKYWITSDSGIVLFNHQKTLISYRGHNNENDPVIRQYEKQKALINVVTDKQHIYFYGTPDFSDFPLLHSYNRTTGQASIIDPRTHLKVNYYEVHGLLQQRNGNLWAHGVYMFAQWLPDQQNFIPVPNSYKGEQSIKFNYANFAFEDRERNIWIATDNGLFRFNPEAQVFHSYSLLHAEEKGITDVVHFLCLCFKLKMKIYL
jgi:ligand-binding sensor domain-containing protein